MTANKALGQHWLKNREILDEIAGLTGGGEVCLEIGPGLGTLTSALFRQFSRVIAVEFDAELARKLPGQFPGKSLEVVNADILKFDFSGLPAGYKVAGNIPYYITSPIIEKLIDLENPPEKIVLLMQKEVAERAAAADGKSSFLSLLVANRATATLGPVVRAAEFSPAPKVDSQVLILEPHAPKVASEVLDLIKRGFSSPRKKLTHNLAGVKEKAELEKILENLGLSPDARPADLSLEDFARLLEACRG